ncbi:hypothetical protein [Microbacterium album]|uniref:Uncharacterized protein n=1 Tax=Microbacterium album TaxID=2053191 RepID=A0A917IEK6_9MICO|nr:hypothetical protein [Microbacterium album]GGH45368.1 hypothetical protein GCM10010921_20710 [Microbacterium album]
MPVLLPHELLADVGAFLASDGVQAFVLAIGWIVVIALAGAALFFAVRALVRGLVALVTAATRPVRAWFSRSEREYRRYRRAARRRMRDATRGMPPAATPPVTADAPSARLFQRDPAPRRISHAGWVERSRPAGPRDWSPAGD